MAERRAPLLSSGASATLSPVRRPLQVPEILWCLSMLDLTLQCTPQWTELVSSGPLVVLLQFYTIVFPFIEKGVDYINNKYLFENADNMFNPSHNKNTIVHRFSFNIFKIYQAPTSIFKKSACHP